MKNLEALGWKSLRKGINGDYWFSGDFFYTKEVLEKLSQQEIFTIYTNTRRLARQREGIDYLQVYVHKAKKYSLFLIDNVEKSALDNKEIAQEHNYSTLMFNYEY